MMSRLDVFSSGLRRMFAAGVATLLVSVPLTASAFRTPFGNEVNASIERGLQYLRNQEGGNGQVDGTYGTGLAMLAFLEKRASADWDAPTVGYRGSSPDDQARLQRMARYVVDNVEGVRLNAKQPSAPPAYAP